jgi:hypothetical protein
MAWDRHNNLMELNRVVGSQQKTKYFKYILQEEFGYTKGVIRIRISKKNRQCNGQKK